MAGMTVKQVIKELKKMPDDAPVVFHNHDQDANEFDDFVRYIEESEEMDGMEGITVVVLGG